MKVVVLIGCSKGIGLALAQQLVREEQVNGTKIVLVSRTEPQELKLLTEEKANVEFVGADVGSDADMSRFRTVISTRYEGTISTLIWNAGTTSCLSAEELHQLGPEEVSRIVESIYRTNTEAPVKFVINNLDLLKRSRTHIVVISSIAGRVGTPTRSLYSSTKHALNGFFDSIRIELDSADVCVTIVCPYTVNTGFRQRALENIGAETSHGNLERGGRGMSVDKCASDILKVVQRGRNWREVWIPAWMRFITLIINVLFPGLIDLFARRKYANK